MSYQIRLSDSSKPVNTSELTRRSIAAGIDVSAAVEALDAAFAKKEEQKESPH